MFNFLKKMTDWILEKEEELAKNCKIRPEDVEKELSKVKEKKEAYQKEYEEVMSEFNKMEERLNKILEEAKKCDIK